MLPWLLVIGNALAAAVVVYLLAHKNSDDQEDRDLQLEWLFSGNAQDSSGKNRHGIVHGASAVPDRKGAANGAYSFNGSSHYIEGPNFIAQKNNQISVSFWIKTASSSSMLRFPINSNDFAISQYSGDIFMDISIPTTNSAKASVTQQVWTHFVGTYNGTEISIYKNGMLAASKSHPGNISSSNDSFSVGRFKTNYWSGAIDDIRVYSRVLSQSDITKLYSE